MVASVASGLPIHRVRLEPKQILCSSIFGARKDTRKAELLGGNAAASEASQSDLFVSHSVHPNVLVGHVHGVVDESFLHWLEDAVCRHGYRDFAHGDRSWCSNCVPVLAKPAVLSGNP